MKIRCEISLISRRKTQSSGYYVRTIPKMLQSGFDLTCDPIQVIATETIFDGILMEGFFARVAAAAASQCEEPATLNALEPVQNLFNK